MNNRKFSSDLIVSISAIVIALASIIVAVWQGIENRNHNRLSVRPRLDMSFSLDYADSLAQLKIRNNGLGPAVIDEAKAVIENKDFDINKADELFNFLSELGIHDISVTYQLLSLGSTIIPNDTKKIFSIKISNLKKLGLDPNNFINNVKFIIKYKSLYEEEFVIEHSYGD